MQGALRGAAHSPLGLPSLISSAGRRLHQAPPADRPKLLADCSAWTSGLLRSPSAPEPTHTSALEIQDQPCPYSAGSEQP